jgi:hypothetical protein
MLPFHEPVAKWVPELRDAAKKLRNNATMPNDKINHLRWDEVTIGELASHLAGVIREYIVSLAFGFRAVFHDKMEGDTGIGPFTRNCKTWALVGRFAYGDVGLDEFEFELDGDGRAVSLSPRALRLSLPRNDK